ncbi:YmfL family putative regulatory protein [Ectopseudomonas mendocina]|uniref:YmfL family putative regulatory protein n=1 Tax=Ectopseudomonas mendocina TaxID=300 RepID=UPI000206DF32|nr:YmfL family putative regulatory protein [Pseudomonas mendocina]AEB58195.1 hypothetical protein MDS_2164 [Pseudomonas mendocina NK-01]
MKRPILDSRRRAVLAVVAAFPGGRECAATWLGLDLKQFDNKLYENPGHRPLTDEQVLQLEKVAGTSYLPDYISGLYNGVYVAMPELAELDNIDLLERAMTTTIKRGTVDAMILTALKDGEINEAELASIICAHRQHMAARHAEVSSILALHSKRQEPKP